MHTQTVIVFYWILAASIIAKTTFASVLEVGYFQYA